MSVAEIMQIEDETKRKDAMMAHLAAGGQHPASGCQRLPRLPYDAIQPERGSSSDRGPQFRISSCFPSEPVALPD